MEAVSDEAGAKNHLNDVLSETEIASLPNPVAEKINAYIDKKFEEYLTSKALHETSKTQIGMSFFKPVPHDACNSFVNDSISYALLDRFR